MSEAVRDRESERERIDRNWSELLQEVRVIQTGTQILTGFLLALVFQPRFVELDSYQVSTYLALVAFAVVTTILALTPVSLHRALFRRQAKDEIVRIANRVVKVTLTSVAVTLIGTVLFIVDVVVGRPQGWIAGAITLTGLVLAWVAIPFGVRRLRR